ncbi:carotenoid oxygenase family protein [Aliterella atlantica]|uniref:Membrane protein n=1 Tax=Aliterella atlantica CENA595 TaxID=1618023 RepID=A0A0D8ZP25_9CYAN|nr:carotenoid oxygenase family protein [Aliterella atlantica]KJH70573.1 membrane protein [Aliterella atlantica CENA595]
MHTIEKLSTNKAWSKAIAQPAKEFAPTKLSIISGSIPQGLRGSLYRNGPARLERGGIKVGHWFDGDGAILAVHFSADGAEATYRYVQTAGYQEEANADRLLYGNYGMTAPGAIWNQWFKPIKNAANTSVLALPDRLLALWEGGNPHALDLETLATWGTDELGALENNLPYSAHPKCDAQTGEIFNFGISPGINAKLNIYKSDRTGKITKKTEFPLDGIPLIHDFVLAGQYLVFFVPPVRVNPLPLLLGLSNYSDALEWQPQLGTQVLVFDRHSLSLVSRIEAEPWYQWHFANGYVDDSSAIVAHIIRYEDFQTNQYLKEVATGETHRTAKSSLWETVVHPTNGKVRSQQILDNHCEFPVVPPQHVGKAASQTYLSLHRPGVDTSKELLGAIARFDNQTKILTVADMGENHYPTEPIYAPKSENPDLGWIVTVVYDGNTDTSEVWVFDSDGLDREPVCRLALPSVIPPGFHGTWHPA